MTDPIDARTDEILAEWEAVETELSARYDAHGKWVEEMVAQGHRRESLPCVHGTAFWPDRGQVCWTCEVEGEDLDTLSHTGPQERRATAREVALRELAARVKAEQADELPPF